MARNATNNNKSKTKHKRESKNQNSIAERIPKTFEEIGSSRESTNNTVTESKIADIESIKGFGILIRPILFTIYTLHNLFARLLSLFIYSSTFRFKGIFKQGINIIDLAVKSYQLRLDSIKNRNDSVSVSVKSFTLSQDRIKGSKARRKLCINIACSSVYLLNMSKNIYNNINNILIISIYNITAKRNKPYRITISNKLEFIRHRSTKRSSSSRNNNLIKLCQTIRSQLTIIRNPTTTLKLLLFIR